MPLAPELVPILDAMNQGGALPTDKSPAELRAQMHEVMDTGILVFAEDPPEVARIEDYPVPVEGGEITVRVYTPPGTAPFPAHLYIHGGGFWLGTLDQSDVACKELCAGADCVVASVDYRLAPEHKFPTAPNDCFAALQWLFMNATELGIDTTRVSVGGASAGGNLAAVIALMARDRGGPPLVFQHLEIPATDMTMSSPSITENGEGYLLTKAGMEQCTAFYLDEPADAKHPFASPLLAHDLSGLPPALVVTCEFDPLRDEGEAYAERLRAAGVPTESIRMEGHIHGSMGFTRLLPSAREYRARVLETLRRAYG